MFEKTMNDIDLNLLPGELREIAQLIGIPATMALVGKYGGVGLYVPIELKPDHPLIELIGAKNAEKLSARYPGDEIEIGKAEAAMRELRNREIRSQYPALSQRALALKYNTTERNIRLILGECARNDDQMTLF